jgi:hypothetical protein
MVRIYTIADGGDNRQIHLNMYNMVDKEKQENEKGIIIQTLC